jgi:CheY-like chemotaxis protein
MLERLIGDDVTLSLELCSEPVLTEVDPGQLEQVLVNLALNGRDAMASGGELRLSTSVGRDEAVVSVRDSGTGMDEPTRLRIFEPFFTTKEPGHGTGLGLSTAYGIINHAGGKIEVETELGVGTIFRVPFPRTRREPLAATGPKPSRGELPTGAETILLVEDQDVVRELVKASLGEWGYSVRSAATPTTAIELAANHDFDLLLTDVMMPEMNGRELADLLATNKPGLRVLFMSGYADEVLHEDGVLREGTNFLEKPFALSDLADKVRTILDGPPPAYTPRQILAPTAL